MLKRVTHHITTTQQHLVLAAGVHHGTNFVLGHIRDTHPNTLWVHLPDRHDLDPIEQGNLLAAATNKAFGQRLLPHGLPLAKALAAFRLYARAKTNTYLLISNAHAQSEFLTTVLEQAPNLLKVVAACEDWPTDKHGETATTIPADDLLLTEEEALAWPRNGLSQEAALEAWQESNGILVPFLVNLAERSQVPPPLMPGADQPQFLPGQEVQVPPELLFEALVLQERWTHALELALATMPERTGEVLDQAGHAFHQLGQHQRLYTLIGRLPEETRASLPALFWLLSSALRIRKQEEHREEVEAYLAEHEAPELRALYAGTMLPYEQGLKEAERAYRTQKTPLTAFQYGRMLFEPEQAITVLNESIQLAEQVGYPYEIVRNAEALATKHLRTGQYEKAEQWAAHGLQKYREHNLTDEYRHLLLLNAWAFARLMLGKTAGLEDTLREYTRGRDSGLLIWARHLFRSTTADFLLASNRPSEALPIYQELLEETGRQQQPKWLYGITRCLLQLGRRKEAQELIDHNLGLLESETSDAHYPAMIARSLILLEHQPREAERDAETVFNDTRAPMWHRLQAALTLAAIHLLRDDKIAAKEVLSEHQEVMRTVGDTGRTLLAPAVAPFDQVWALEAHLSEDIEVQLLGTPARIFRQQEPVKTTPRMQEALAIILLSPHPLSTDEFLQAMGETERRPMQVLLSKLRNLLPVSKTPLTLDAFHWCDALEVLEACNKNDPKTALRHYRGPLLPFSDSPGVVEHRDHLEATLRKCVLQYGDTEDILSLAQKTHDDLELWEIARDRTRPESPEAALIATRIDRLEREYALN